MSTSPLRALVVEDDPVWQAILAEVLTDCGLSVDLADSLEAALPLLRGAPHRLVVADLALSDSDHHNQEGLHVLDTVREIDPACVSILLTGYATVELAVSVLTEHGALTCLRKETFNRRQFRELVGRALATLPAAGDAGPSAESARAEGSELAALTEREREVLELLARGLTNKEIAEALVITPNTVKQHLKAIFEKLGVHTRSAAAATALRARNGAL
ncbi:MAG: response regulator transcription factor [Anaerolineae bacterium]